MASGPKRNRKPNPWATSATPISPAHPIHHGQPRSQATASCSPQTEGGARFHSGRTGKSLVIMGHNNQTIFTNYKIFHKNNKK
jgi:hypothetical protein